MTTAKVALALAAEKKYMGYSKINEEVRYRPTSTRTIVRTIETIEASDLTQAQVEFSFVSIQLEIWKPGLLGLQ